MRGRPPQVSREALLDAAAEVLLRNGADARTAEIARQAGVSEGLLFYRFRSKDELIAAVIDHQLSPPGELMQLIRDPGDRSAADALAGVVRLVLHVLRRALPYVEIARSSPGSDAILRAAARSGATPDRLVDLVSRHFEAEAARGRLRPVPPSIAGRVVVGAAVERTLSEHSPVGHPPLDDDDAFVYGVVGLLLDGAAPRPASARRSSQRRSVR